VRFSGFFHSAYLAPFRSRAAVISPALGLSDEVCVVVVCDRGVVTP
jgi:hypothetical protein